MIGQTVTFDGHTLNDLFRVGNVDAQLPLVTPALEDARFGSNVRNVRQGTSTITIPLVAKHLDGRDVRESVSTLLSWLDVDGAKWLTLSGDGGLKRLAVPDGALTVDDPEWGDVLTLTLTQVDPYLYGEERTVPWPTTAPSVTFSVGGDAPTRLSVSCAEAKGASSSPNLWQLLMDGTKLLAVATGTTSARAVAIDCGARTATVGTDATTITLASDWLELTPGEHELELTAGSITAPVYLSYVERWHR